MAGVFISGASFEVDGNVVMYGLPYSDDLQKKLNGIVEGQFEKLLKLEAADLRVDYKIEDDEIWRILEYKDPDRSLELFLGLKRGENTEFLREIDCLSHCKALFYWLPNHPKYVLIQRFSNVYVAKRDKWFGIFDKDTLSEMDRSAFKIPSSLCGYFDIEKCALYFKNLNSIRGALPGFAGTYSPEADVDTQREFFSKPCFDERSWGIVSKRKLSKKMAQLVWIIESEGQNLTGRLRELEEYDQKLNLKCFENGKVLMSSDRKKNETILNVLSGNVLGNKEDIFLVNSKKVINPFE